MNNPPLLQTLTYDPILSNVKLIAEAWDAGGMYQMCIRDSIRGVTSKDVTKQINVTRREITSNDNLRPKIQRYRCV